MSNSEIINICQQLKKEGKEPSVALIKSRMTGPKILPNIIAGLKAWQAAPNQSVEVTSPSETSTTEAETLEQRVKTLETLVVELQARLIKLEQG